MSDTSSVGQKIGGLFGSGSLGVGAVLVALPALLLFFGASYLKGVSIIGLPLLAIFGIMILFGSLALVAMLFQSLGLSDREQPLALPEGSIRAAIALSLIVLFAIISIMLFQSTPGVPFEVGGLDGAQRNELVAKATDRVLSVTAAPCAASAGGDCADADRRYSVRLRPGVAGETLDLAKQLLVLVGTLMTSVTSYYFAARGNATPAPDGGKPAPNATPAPPAPAPPPEQHVDGCDAAITDPTPDDQLPATRGGVAPAGG